MERLINKESLDKFSDRDLLLLLLSNQIQIFKKIESIEGSYDNAFRDLISDADHIIEQCNEYLSEH
jgi:hypothetical protein